MRQRLVCTLGRNGFSWCLVDGATIHPLEGDDPVALIAQVRAALVILLEVRGRPGYVDMLVAGLATANPPSKVLDVAS